MKILGVKVDNFSKEEVVELVRQRLKTHKKTFIATPNPEVILAAQKDKALAQVLNSADISIADGVGLKIADASLKIVKGRELMVALFKLANELGLKVYLLGATEAVNQKALKMMGLSFPKVRARGDSGPLVDENALPKKDSDKAKEKKVVAQVDRFKPDLLFVALGTPKEEKWIAKWLPKLEVKVVMHVGGALDYFSGVVKLPPIWMEKANLEWLWRLVNEPKRARRIVNATIIFPLTVLKQKLENI